MDVAVIGTGGMGRGIARLLTSSHRVRIGSRDPARGADVAKELGAAEGGSDVDAAAGADVVLLCVPWTAVDETLPRLGDLTGRILVDITNPYVDGKLQPHEGTSNAEIIASKVPGARVVKGWNTIFSPVIDAGPDFGGQAASVFLASDDEEAKDTVASLARDMGFDPVDTGPLESAQALERLLTVLGTLGHPFGWGKWSLKILSR